MGRGRKGRPEGATIAKTFRRQIEDALLRRVLLGSSSNWRAAAWYLERTRPDSFARGDRESLSFEQLQECMAKVAEIVDTCFTNPREKKAFRKELYRLTADVAMEAGRDA